MNLSILKRCILFKDMPLTLIESLFSRINYCVKNYSGKEIILEEDSLCPKIGIVLKGTACIEKLFPTGKNINITQLGPGQIFGLVSFFSKEGLTQTVVTSHKDCTVLFIPQNDLLSLFECSRQVLYNYTLFCNKRISFLNEKLEIFSLGSIREKVVYFILLESNRQKNSEKITLPFSKEKMAHYLGISKASLYREMNELFTEKLISYANREISILNYSELNTILHSDI